APGLEKFIHHIHDNDGRAFAVELEWLCWHTLFGKSIGCHRDSLRIGWPKAPGSLPCGRREKREPSWGHNDKDRPTIIAWVSRQGSVVLRATKDCTVKTVQDAVDVAVHAGSRLSTDSASSSRAVLPDSLRPDHATTHGHISLWKQYTSRNRCQPTAP